MGPALDRIIITDEKTPRLVVQFRCFADFINIFCGDVEIGLPQIKVDEKYFLNLENEEVVAS